jgi:formylmethanofuran dehydrogenase subunit E
MKKEMTKTMPYSDDPISDFHRHDAAQQKKLNKLPVCHDCDEPIQTDECFEFNDELFCPDCLVKYHRKWTDDYIS